MTPKVSVDDFVIAWATALTIDDVVKATGMTRQSAKARAKYLRDKGIGLPRLRKISKQVSYTGAEIARLNALIKKHDRKDR